MSLKELLSELEKYQKDPTSVKIRVIGSGPRIGEDRYASVDVSQVPGVPHDRTTYQILHGYLNDLGITEVRPNTSYEIERGNLIPQRNPKNHGSLYLAKTIDVIIAVKREIADEEARARAKAAQAQQPQKTTAQKKKFWIFG
jgi:hypothetical protein